MLRYDNYVLSYVLPQHLRRIAVVAGALALAIGVLAYAPGRLVMHPFELDWFDASDTRSFTVVAAGGLVGALHAALLLLLAGRMWQTPTSARGWQYVGFALIAELVDRGVSYVRFAKVSTHLNAAGHAVQALALAHLAIALVVLPLVLLRAVDLVTR